MENTVFRTSRVQRRGSKSINPSSENWEPVTPNMVSTNCVLSHSGSRRWGSEDGFLFVSQSCSAPLSPLGQQDTVTEPSGPPWPVLSTLGLSDWSSPAGCSLGNTATESACPKLARLHELKRKEKTTHSKQTLSNSLALSTATSPFVTALT